MEVDNRRWTIYAMAASERGSDQSQSKHQVGRLVGCTSESDQLYRRRNGRCFYRAITSLVRNRYKGFPMQKIDIFSSVEGKTLRNKANCSTLHTQPTVG